MNMQNIRQNFTQHGASIIILLVLGLLLLSLSMWKPAKGFTKNDLERPALKVQPAGNI
ncbi:hypothetical protein MKQ70_31640 [Chitinophaga sedimenti]|uniref:hypothetical protein n=1 Tax=Chitinophaga sedimenti TaxID=2033606 RepID=UPI00200562DC|nr:hypothetical protein [Chitinophaga sedimenti]MCK7559276.1 hypothetical protein [Chitinophaga sedimenti]